MTVQCGCKSPSRGRSGREVGADPRAAAADLVADHTAPRNTNAPRNQQTALGDAHGAPGEAAHLMGCGAASWLLLTG